MAVTGSSDEVTQLRERMERSPTIPYGWRPLLVLTAVTLIDRIETSIVSGVMPLLQDEWGFGDTAGGAIATAAGIAGILVTLPAGYLADRQDRRRLIAIVVALWSIITLGSAIAIGFLMFFATRVVLGAADSMEQPSASSLIADYYPVKTRARAYGLHRMTFFAGGGIGILLGGVLGEVFGWRAAFLAIIIPGAFVAWLALRLVEPPRGAIDRIEAQAAEAEDEVEPAAEPESLEAAMHGGPVLEGGWPAFREQLGEIMAVPTLRRIFIGLFTLFVGVNGIIFWLPTFFDRAYDTGTGLGGTYSAVIGLIGIVGGAMIGGALGDRWHGNRPAARVLLGGSGLVGGSLVLGFSLIDLPLIGRILLLTVSLLLLAIAIPNLMAAVTDVCPIHVRGAGFALLQLFLAVGAAGGPLAVGAVSDAIGSLTMSFTVLVIPMVLGSFLVLGARISFEDDAAACAANSAARLGSGTESTAGD